MTPADIKALRTELRCTTRELAQTIGADQETVLSWERGDTFPTKQWVDKMNEARKLGPSGVLRRPKKSSNASPFAALSDPDVWLVFRKLLANPDLLDQVKALCASVEDPAVARPRDP